MRLEMYSTHQNPQAYNPLRGGSSLPPSYWRQKYQAEHQTDVEKLWDSEVGRFLRSELAELSLKYGGLNLWGSRSERAHLRMLKNDIEDWLQCLQSSATGWWFPDALRCIRSSELILKDWDYRLHHGVWPIVAGVDPEDEKLSKQTRRWEKPDKDVLDRVWRLVNEERKLWSSLIIKYCEVIANKYEDIDDRLDHCRGIVTFETDK